MARNLAHPPKQSWLATAAVALVFALPAVTAEASIILPTNQPIAADELLCEADAASAGSRSTSGPRDRTENDVPGNAPVEWLTAQWTPNGGQSSGASSPGGASQGGATGVAVGPSIYVPSLDSDLVRKIAERKSLFLPSPPGMGLLRPPQF